MSLSGVGFASVESAIASSYAAYAARDNNGVIATTTSIQYISTTNIFIVGQPQQVTQNLLANGIAELLTNLTANNLVGSKQVLSNLQAGLGGVEISGVTGLFSQLTSVLNAGNSAQALDKIHNFLLGSGAVRGNTFDATV